jgi:hypothetical protein
MIRKFIGAILLSGFLGACTSVPGAKEEKKICDCIEKTYGSNVYSLRDSLITRLSERGQIRDTGKTGMFEYYKIFYGIDTAGGQRPIDPQDFTFQPLDLTAYDDCMELSEGDVFLRYHIPPFRKFIDTGLVISTQANLSAPEIIRRTHSGTELADFGYATFRIAFMMDVYKLIRYQEENESKKVRLRIFPQNRWELEGTACTPETLPAELSKHSDKAKSQGVLVKLKRGALGSDAQNAEEILRANGYERITFRAAP